MKTKSDSAKAFALAESDEEAVELRSHRSFADGSETLNGYFLWDRPGNGSAKTWKK